MQMAKKRDSCNIFYKAALNQALMAQNPETNYFVDSETNAPIFLKEIPEVSSVIFDFSETTRIFSITVLCDSPLVVFKFSIDWERLWEEAIPPMDKNAIGPWLISGEEMEGLNRLDW